MLSSPKSAGKSVKDESHLEETPKMLSKGKHTSGKRKVCLLILSLHICISCLESIWSLCFLKSYFV